MTKQFSVSIARAGELPPHEKVFGHSVDGRTIAGVNSGLGTEEVS